MADDELAGLRNFCQCRRNAGARILGWISRRSVPRLPSGVLTAAHRVHMAKFLHSSRESGDGGDRHGRDLDSLRRQVDPRHGNLAEVLERSVAFARNHRAKAIGLLKSENLKDRLESALKADGLGGSAAATFAGVVYAAIVAQCDADSDPKRPGYYEAAMRSLQSVRIPLGEQLKRLSDLETEARANLSAADGEEVFKQLAQLRRVGEQDTSFYEHLLETTTRGVDLSSDRELLTSRLKELADLGLAIDSSTGLDKPRLKAELNRSISFLETLKTRERDLTQLADCPRLQATLRGLDKADSYVEAMHGLKHVLRFVNPDAHQAVREQLDSMIGDARSARWLSLIHDGDVDVIDTVFSRAERDDDALSLKRNGRSPQTADGRPLRTDLAVSMQHNRRIVARALDEAMAAEGGPRGVFRAVKPDARILRWLLINAPKTRAARNLMIADWIRLSFSDPITGELDSASTASLLQQVGVADTAQIEKLLEKGGFSSTDAVEDCRKEFLRFMDEAQKTRLHRALDWERAETIGIRLLGRQKVRAEKLTGDGIDRQVQGLIKKELPWLGEKPPSLLERRKANDLLRTIRRVAVLQVALQKKDPSFTLSKYRQEVLVRMGGLLGVDFDRLEPGRGPRGASKDGGFMQGIKQHLLEKNDERELSELCDDFDPTPGVVRLASGVAAAIGLDRAAAPQDAGEPRGEANERTLKEAFDKLQPNQAVKFRFGERGELLASVPVPVPGLSVGAKVSVESDNSILVVRLPDGRYSVELRAVAGRDLGISLAAFRDSLGVSVEGGRSSAAGFRFTFENGGDCRECLSALAGGDKDKISPEFWGARVETLSGVELRAGASVSARADLALAELSATLAARGSRRHEVYTSAHRKTDVYHHEIGMSAEIAAEAVFGKAAGKIEKTTNFSVRRSVASQHGVLTDDTRVTFAKQVTQDNGVDACLKSLLPTLDRERLAAHAGRAADATEVFVTYRLTGPARESINATIGKARLARDEGRHADASAHMRKADELSRSPKSYEPEGFGWTLRSSQLSEVSVGGFSKYSGSEDRATRFEPFAGDASSAATRLEMAAAKQLWRKDLVAA